MKKLLKDSFTENDNETFCMARVTWASSFLAICVVSGLTIVTGGTIGIVELGVALATIAAGHSAAIKLKK